MSPALHESSGLVYDPFLPLDDPFPIYRRLRDEAPLYHNEKWDFWALSRFEDVQAAARDPETFVSRHGNDLDETFKLFEPAGELTRTDPPDHTRLRDAVRRDFSPKTVQANLAAEVRRKTLEIIDSHRGSTEVDFASSLAQALPGHMVCTWLGFPSEDHPKLLEWFRQMQQRIPGQLQLPPVAFQARDEMRQYVEHAASSRRRREGSDLLTTIVRANLDGEIHDHELPGLVMMMFNAGIATTSGLLSTSLWQLGQRPDDQAMLREDPSLIPNAVEEFLRFDSPLQGLVRTTSSPVEMHGETTPAGAKVLLMWGSANRDERRWEQPDELDFQRERQRNVAFGVGIHHCLGAPLARLEGTIALEELTRATRTWQLSEPAERLFSTVERILVRVPTRVEWAAS